MRLAVRELGGDGEPLVVLHGLFGSSRNWGSAGRDLAARFRVLAFDLRGHGDSPHAPGIGYDALASDVRETMDELGLSRAFLLGHSLGGKTAMRFACDAPARVSHLLVADIAPREYTVDRAPLAAMLAASLDGVARRAEVEEQLLTRLGDRSLAQFLLTNLVRTEAGGFAWRVDLEAIRDGFAELGRSPVGDRDRYDGPVDFFAGERSPYFAPGDLEVARRYFPRARLHVLAGSGHDVHVDAREAFVKAVIAAVGDPP